MKLYCLKLIPLVGQGLPAFVAEEASLLRRSRLAPAIILVLLCSNPAWCEIAEKRLELPRGPNVILWESEESYPGKAQADPRLDQPVKFWRAGLTMTEVFAGVKEQTGVEVRFWPLDDLNTRIRVNLYLNPKEPPPLRDLMAQLMWVLDCGFAWTEEEGEKVYYLLATSLGRGVLERIRTENKNKQQNTERVRYLQRQDALAKLPIYREALKLSRKEAIERYSSVDDMLLLNLLDPRYCTLRYPYFDFLPLTIKFRLTR